MNAVVRTQSSASLYVAGGVSPTAVVVDAIAEAVAGPGTRVVRWKEHVLKPSRFRPRSLPLAVPCTSAVPPGGRVLDLNREAERAAEQAAALAAAEDRLGSSTAGQVRTVARSLDPCLRDGGGAPLVPTHGDYQPKNVLTGGPNGRRVTVIDFDRFAWTSPARDVGHFLAQSATMTAARTGSLRDARGWNEAFLARYARGKELPARRDLAAATVRSLLEILYYRLVVRPMPEASFLPGWLDECERQLSAVT